MSTTRITVKDLDRAVIGLNTLLGYTMGQDGSFCLQGAYGGWQLQRRQGSGVASVTGGYIPKRALFDRITDMRRGAEIAFDRAQTPRTQGTIQP